MIQISIWVVLSSLLFQPASCYLISSECIGGEERIRSEKKESMEESSKRKHIVSTSAGSLSSWLRTSKEETEKSAKFNLTSNYWTLMLGSESQTMIKMGSLPSDSPFVARDICTMQNNRSIWLVQKQPKEGLELQRWWERKRILKRGYSGWEVPQTYIRREKIFQPETIVNIDTEAGTALYNPRTGGVPVCQEQKLRGVVEKHMGWYLGGGHMEE